MPITPFALRKKWPATGPAENGVRTAALFLVSCAVLFSSCHTEKKVAVNKNECAGVMCTDIFNAVTVRIVDAAGNGVALTTHSTVRKRDKAVLGRVRNDAADGGSYVVLDDSSVASLRNSQDTLTFSGTTAAGRSLGIDFVIGADCCHIYKVSGPELLALQ